MRKGKWITSELIVLAVSAVVALACESPILEGEVGYNVAQCDFGISAIISLAIAAASAAASAGVAGAQSKKAKKEQEKAQRELDNWYENEMAGNILDRADTRSMLAEYRNTMTEQNKKYLNNAIKGGASDEAKVAFNESMNKGYADAMSKILAQGQLRKDQVADSYRQGKMDASTRMSDIYMQTGQQMGNAISSAGSGLSSAVGGMDLGSIGKVEGGGIGFIKPKA